MLFTEAKKEKIVLSAVEKEKIVLSVLEDAIPVSEVSKKYSVARKTVYAWIKRYKKGNLAPLYIKGKKHPAAIYPKAYSYINRWIVAHPGWGCRTMSAKLKEKGINLSHVQVNKLLNRIGAENFDRRINYARNFAGPGRSSEDVRLEVVKKAVDGRISIYSLSEEYKVARKTIYKWIKKYESAGKIKDSYVTGASHPRAIYPKITQQVLNLVVSNPEYSVHTLAKFVPASSWTIWSILNRNNLNIYGLRLEYSRRASEAAVQKVPAGGIFGRIRSVFESFTPNLAPAPPPKFSSILKTFGISSVFTFLIVYGSLLWASVISGGGSFGAGIGLTFAFVALAAGMFFFIYSLKYYLTTAILLSFSNRQKKDKVDLENPGMNADLSSVHIKKYPFVSVHIPFYNEKNVVERSIKAATNFDYPEYEVILCDDSTDETSDKVRAYQKSLLFKGESLKEIKGDGWTLTEVRVRAGVTLKHLHRTTRLGYKGGALALALKLVDSRTEFISIFDADFVPYPDSLNYFVKYFKVANSMDENYEKSNIAAVQGYQWHVLNKSENWITRGVRSEYAGSYVVERSGAEIYKGLKQISGSVYMIRKDVLSQIGWGTSITEDFELTLKLYNAGYKVVYTPYVQAPAECVSTLKRMIRQRMRWAEGHSFNVKLMAWKLLTNPKLTIKEKLEFAYLMPYYLQAFFFLVGTFSWLLSESVFKVRLPFWTELWGWSLVLTNMVALPLLNAVGMFLEESSTKDYSGLGSFVILSYIVVPFQAYAAVKGFLEKEEGPWFRTPKTGKITDVFKRGKFYKFISEILPGKATGSAPSYELSPYLALTTANNKYNNFKITPHKAKWIGKIALVVLLIISLSIISLTPYINNIPVAQAATIFNANHNANNFNEYSSTLTTGGDLTTSSAAAMAGTAYGMNILMDDANLDYAQYTNGIADTSGKVRVRFYIDPNSMAMSTNDSVTVYRNYAVIPNYYPSIQVILKWTGTTYQIVFGYYNDDVYTVTYTYYNITDAPHYVEFELDRASTTSSNNGKLYSWIDGVAKDSITNINNYDVFANIILIRFGNVLIGGGNGNWGTFFLDELRINDDGSAIGSATEPFGTIINITHESGTLSEYKLPYSYLDGGKLSVTAGAALAGTSYGLNVLIDEANAKYGEVDGLNSSTNKVRARFYFDPNTITMANYDDFAIFGLYSGTTATAVVRLHYDPGQYTIIACLFNDAAGSSCTSNLSISDAPHYIEVYQIRATTNVSSDGSLQIWIDGTSVATITGVDNYDTAYNFNQLRAGALYGIDAGTSGTIYIDEIKVNDDGTAIGAVPENLWVLLGIVPFIPIWLKKRKQKGEIYNFSKLV